jgi:CspA family cold shock protein
MSHPNRQTGTVKWYNDEKGFGFITSDFGGEIVVRRQSLRTQRSNSLKEGQKVSYEVLHEHRILMADQVQPEE